ncbi:hypothetical protein AAFF_G00163240 [Aldrovandia affinis]|uniref:Protein FAM26F n=1 Tax=Aldrovandia affinis TaxID=143900 RepID=A0AAD7T1A3_9TELE|nr:hypothetical protein AAFF_G00163240 [Aldrovandia affinis]
MDKFRTVLNIAQKQQTTLGFGLVTLLTVGVEQIFSAVVFKCPCSSWNFAYGTVFLLVPALALLALGYALNIKIWKMCTGICMCKPNPCSCENCWVFFIKFMKITTSALVAPVSWIAVALLDGNYFECTMTGSNSTWFKNHVCAGKVPECQRELYRFPCKTSSVPETERDDVMGIIRAESQVLGWSLIAFIMTAALLLTCVAKCCSRISYVQLKFWQVYAQKENDLLEKYTTNHAQELAERNLKSFFEQKHPEPIVTPNREAFEKVSLVYHSSWKKEHHSILHQYVESKV